jgi:hypothetical protein
MLLVLLLLLLLLLLLTVKMMDGVVGLWNNGSHLALPSG